MTAPSPATKNGIKQTECRFAVHSTGKEDRSDFHLIKLVDTKEDGTQVPRLSYAREFKRPFWVLKKGERTFKDFREWISQDKLNRYETTQSRLTESVANALGKPYFRGGMKDLCQEPYVFGTDISSTAIIKHDINDRAELTPYSVGVYDTEVDVVHGTDQVIINTISFKTHIYTAVKASFLKGYSDPIPGIQALIQRYLGTLLAERGATVVVEVFETEYEIIKACVKRIHDWMPDFVAVWNIEYDMDKIIDACARVGVDPAELLSHPSVPKEYRHFKFKKGAAKKETASGRIINFKPSQRWHEVRVPSASFWIDAMQSYRQVRTGAPEEPSYALDAILAKHKLPSKLKFADLDDAKAPPAGTLQWHQYMQEKYPLHYVVYNIFDCVGVEMLDESTKDLQLSLPMFAGCTDFGQFNSLPRKTTNELHWECLKEGKVISSTASDMTTDGDDATTDVKGWIVMLATHQIADNGLQLIKGMPQLRTNIRTHGADLDVAGAYPTNESTMNVSRETTVCELVKMIRANGEEIPEEVVRAQTINFSGGKTNSLEFCQVLFGMPTLTELVEHYDASLTNTTAPVRENFVSRFRKWLYSNKKAQPHLGW